MREFDAEIVLSAEVAGAEGVTVKLTALSDVLPENGYIEANAVEDEAQLELMKAAADDILKATKPWKYGSFCSRHHPLQ